jgi:transposase
VADRDRQLREPEIVRGPAVAPVWGHDPSSAARRLGGAGLARPEGVGRAGTMFDPRGRRGAPARIPRRQMVDAMLFLGRTSCQRRYLPERYPPWGTVWQQWRRWRANGVWERAMVRLAAQVRVRHEREPIPSMVMIDAQTVKGGRYGPTFHNAGGRGGRTIGTKRTILVEILGLPLSARADPARPHDVRAGRDLLHDSLAGLPRPGDRRRPWLSGPAQPRQPPQPAARHQGSAEGPGRLQADRPALQGRVPLRPARPLAATVALLRRHGSERQPPGSRWPRSAISWAGPSSVNRLLWTGAPSGRPGGRLEPAGNPKITPARLGRRPAVRMDPIDRSARPQVICRPDRHRGRRR